MHFDWLKNQCLTRVEKQEFTWVFEFGNETRINTPTFWRLIANDGIVAAAGDHEQMFGLQEPVDAGQRVMITLRNQRTRDLVCNKPCYDLIVLFEAGQRLEFFNTSMAYESWTVWNGSQNIICMGGGDLAFF